MLRGLIPVVLIAPLVSCRSPRQEEFQVRVLDVEEREIPAIVLVGDRVVDDPSTLKPVITPAAIQVTFPPRKSGKGYEDVRLGVRAVLVEGDGALRGLKAGDSPYLEDKNSWRYLQPGDARDQVFILRKNRLFKPGG